MGIPISFPQKLGRDRYVSYAVARKHVQQRWKNSRGLAAIFKDGSLATRYVKTSDLHQFLLAQFKTRCSFPHWPFIDKAETTRVDQALLVWFKLNTFGSGPGENTGRWWLPTPVRAAVINRWLSADPETGGAPLLFSKTDIRLRDGTYPSLTLHDTRKYHHTEALLAGAHEVFIDELAGRNSGTQSDHYDLRSPHEILSQSMDTFDPDVDFVVAGPIAEQAKSIKFADRKTFLYENAAPKHLTDIGGCASDWSLDPCKLYGDCMRCDEQLWRKGDEKRLLEIHARRDYAVTMISKADLKIALFEDPPRPLVKHRQQFAEDLARCDLIMAAEADPLIAIGAIVTFAAPPGVMTTFDLTSRLRSENSIKSIKNE